MTEPYGLRDDAIGWLNMRTAGGVEPVTREDVQDYTFRGEKVRLQPVQTGIWKPAGFDATLSIMTVFRTPGKERPYEDVPGVDGLPRYAWRGDNPNHPDNVGLRRAMESRLPLIWFWGVAMAPARFQVIAPVYVVAEEPEQRRFVLAAVEDKSLLPDLAHPSRLIEIDRRYVRNMTKRRVHQPVFRSMVLTAYNNACAVCALPHEELLDAAHIVDDSDEHGIASVANGLALCKIHHAAYDKLFMGIRPDYVIEIRPEVLVETDGPVLEYGLQKIHGHRLQNVPTARNAQPASERLQQKYEQFKIGAKSVA